MHYYLLGVRRTNQHEHERHVWGVAMYWTPIHRAVVHLLTYLLTQLARAYEAGNISETVEDRAIERKLLLTAYIKSYTGFRLSPKCMTLNDF